MPTASKPLIYLRFLKSYNYTPTTGSDGIGWIIEKYKRLTWNDLCARSNVRVASPSKENAVPILRQLKEKHILCSYLQLRGDDETLQWLRGIANSENCGITMFWEKEGTKQNVGSEWAKQNIESIKAPILARSNYISIFFSR